MIEADAQFSIVPGVYNSYKTGDVVFISFEENKMELPVILGKLFVSASAEASSHRGNLSGNSLSITDTAQLPYSTVFDYSNISRNSSLYKNLDTPKKLADNIIDLQQSSVQKYQTIITVLINNTTYLLYLKTAKDFTYNSTQSDESLYRLCTALANSQANNTVIPLDLAGAVLIETVSETVIDEDTNEPVIIEKEIEKTVYNINHAAIQIQEFTPTSLILTVILDGQNYEVGKANILSIQSQAISY
jgi:hypothetical protein